MCGIVGCVLKQKNAAPILLDCISKLEYRGYDSVGIATENNKIYIKKDKGKIIDVNTNLDLADMEGQSGIAHVRWATHGDPSKLNSHPHIDEDNTIAASYKNQAIMASVNSGNIPLNDLELYLRNVPIEERKDTRYKRLLCLYDLKKYDV